MSMNLHCNLSDLWQTPTDITYKIMTQEDGTVSWSLTGEKAKEAFIKYRKWVEEQLTAPNRGFLDGDKERELSHIDAMLEDPTIELWIM